MGSSRQPPLNSHQRRPGRPQGPSESGPGESSGIPANFESQWQDWLRSQPQPADPDCVRLIEIVHGISDLHTQVRQMRLEFLDYLLAMALQEALTLLHAKAPPDHPSPPAK